MRSIFGIMASALGIYSVLILIRIVISWFGGFSGSKPVNLLARVTDPYLDWWRKNLNLRVGIMDLSAIIGITALSIMQRILYTLSYSGRITVGIVLVFVLYSAWSIVFFIFGFFLVILVLRLIAYLANRDIFSPFWRVIDSMSQPVLYRINRIMFGNRIVDYLKGIILSCLLLAVIMAAGSIAVPFLAKLIIRLPV